MTLNWKEVIDTTLRHRRSRTKFDFPINFGNEISSKIIWNWSHETIVEFILAEIAPVEANLNGLFIDGDGI